MSESYWRDGKRHREDGPAVIEREADGSVSESYLRDGKRHREDGPAFIMYSADGSVMRETYSRDVDQAESLASTAGCEIVELTSAATRAEAHAFLSEHRV